MRCYSSVLLIVTFHLYFGWCYGTCLTTTLITWLLENWKFILISSLLKFFNSVCMPERCSLSYIMKALFWSPHSGLSGFCSWVSKNLTVTVHELYWNLFLTWDKVEELWYALNLSAVLFWWQVERTILYAILQVLFFLVKCVSSVFLTFLLLTSGQVV